MTPSSPRTPTDTDTDTDARPASLQRHRSAPACVALACTVLVAGCTWAPPRAWQKDLLARDEMRLDNDGLEQRFTQHIYSSKENSSGGAGVGGGGCGCN